MSYNTYINSKILPFKPIIQHLLLHKSYTGNGCCILVFLEVMSRFPPKSLILSSFIMHQKDANWKIKQKNKNILLNGMHIDLKVKDQFFQLLPFGIKMKNGKFILHKNKLSLTKRQYDKQENQKKDKSKMHSHISNILRFMLVVFPKEKRNKILGIMFYYSCIFPLSHWTSLK